MLSHAQTKGTFTDKRDGKVYKTVMIGSQTWFAENLAFKTPEKSVVSTITYNVSFNKKVTGEAGKTQYTKYFYDVKKDGRFINTEYILIKGSLTTSGTKTLNTSFGIICSWNSTNGNTIFDMNKRLKLYNDLGNYPEIEKAGAGIIQYYYKKKEEKLQNHLSYFANNNDKTKVRTYGYLYTWEAANCGCPAGWHLPDDSEWTTLIGYLGGESVAGGKLKESGSEHWQTSNTATNKSGFTALPGGSRSEDDPDRVIFLRTGERGIWWTSDESSELLSWTYFMNNTSDKIFREETGKGMYLSVRCIKDK